VAWQTIRQINPGKLVFSPGVIRWPHNCRVAKAADCHVNLGASGAIVNVKGVPHNPQNERDRHALGDHPRLASDESKMPLLKEAQVTNAAPAINAVTMLIL